MFLVLEGVDCTGKSTVCRLLSNTLGAEMYVTPPKQIVSRRENVDRFANAEDHYAFYAEGNIISSKEIQDLLNARKFVVCDRYWLTTFVYHLAMGLDLSVSDFDTIVQPDLTVLLTVTPEIQAARFIMRGMSAGDRRMLNSQKKLASLYEEFLPQIPGRTACIRTEELTAQDTCDAILALI